MGIRTLQRTSAALLVAVLAVLTPACGDSDERSLCPVYADWVIARAEINAIDATVETAAQSADDVDDYLDAVAQLRETADSRYRSAIDDLYTATADVLRTLESVDGDADYSTWAPLVEDSIEDATLAAERVVDLIGPQCTPSTTDTTTGS